MDNQYARRVIPHAAVDVDDGAAGSGKRVAGARRRRDRESRAVPPL
jgi:hypothetical protein